MSVNRFLATVTIALAAFGTACAPGGVVSENTTQQPAVVTEEVTTPAETTETEQNTPAESVEQVADTGAQQSTETESAEPAKTMANGEAFDEAYVLELENRMMTAADVETVFAAMSEWLVYLDSAPEQEGVTTTTTMTVEAGALEDIAGQYGVGLDEIQAIIDADPVLKNFFEQAEVVDPEDDPFEQVEEAIEQAEIVEHDHDQDIDHGEFLEEDDWYDTIFLNPEFAEILVPFGYSGDYTCGSHLSHIEAEWLETWTGGSTSDGWLIDAHSTATAFFATPELAQEVFWSLFQCDAERLNDDMMIALGMEGGQPLYLAYEDYAEDGSGLVVFEAPDAGIVVIFAVGYDQLTIHVQYGMDMWTALDEMWWQLGY